MSLDFYPAYLKGKHWMNVVPMEGDSQRLVAGAKMDPCFEGEPFEANPDYFPFSTLNMSGGNAYAILRMIGIDPGEESDGQAPINDVFEKAHKVLWKHGYAANHDQYVMERIFALREMARLGIARGATHIVWA